MKLLVSQRHQSSKHERKRLVATSNRIVASWVLFFRHIKYQKEKEIVTSEREELISKPIPDFVRRSMADYQAGAFFGEDQSPLA